MTAGRSEKRMRVAFDVDDTITRCPEFFALLSRALQAGGHSVFIITYREDRPETEQELRAWGIQYDELVTPTDRDLQERGFYRWKAEACRLRKVDIFFEDMPEVVNLLDESTLAMIPVDPPLGKITYEAAAERPEPPAV
jgi:hypothetical protein